MKLIIILICLALERYWGIGTQLNRSHVLEMYLAAINPYLSKTPVMNNTYVRMATIILAPAFILLLILSVLHGGLYYLVNFPLSVFILLICIGKMANTADNTSNSTTTSSLDILVSFHRQFFSVIFWYILFGLLGAIVYRLSVLLTQTAEEDASKRASFEGWVSLLDWLPVRLQTMIYALVGNFSATFPYALERLLSKPADNRTLLTECGALALGSAVENNGSHQQEAAVLCDRTMIVLIVIVALFTLGSLL